MSFIIALFICVFCHLIEDRDFSSDAKVSALATMGILGILYILFGLILK